MTERVRTTLNYKKPAFWIVIMAAAICVTAAVCFLINREKNAFDIKIVIPAGSDKPFYYSDMEISPKRNQIVLSSGEGLGDTEVVLKPVEAKREDIYEPTYMTPGLPVKMYAEKDAWFQIGVAGSHPDKDLTVYVHVEGVTVRIADDDLSGKIQYNGQWYDRETLSDETITWLEWYNSLSEDGQLAVNFVPLDLYDLAGYGGSEVIAVDAQWDKHPMVMVNDTYYYDTNIESTRPDRSAGMDGEITSDVEGWEIPQENDQSNFGTGYGYQIIDDHTLEIQINGKWIIFETHDSDQ